jgi:hypothetical protein
MGSRRKPWPKIGAGLADFSNMSDHDLRAYIDEHFAPRNCDRQRRRF